MHIPDTRSLGSLCRLLSIVGFLLAMGIILPLPCAGQHADPRLAEAIRLYEADEPAQAGDLLRAMLTSNEVDVLNEANQAKAYTYLAMSEWRLYRRDATEAAVISALELDSETFLAHAGEWSRTNTTILDSVAHALLREAITQYEEAEYDKSVIGLIAVVPIEMFLPTALAAEVHKYLAFNFVAQRKRTLAQEEFRKALRFNPKLTLGDDAVIAPKIRRTFLTIRDNTLQKSRRSAKWNTVLRSVLIPGWGQIHRGDRIRGYGYMSIQTGLLAGSLLSARSYAQARDEYSGFGAAEALALYNQRNDIEEVKAELNARYGRYRSKGKQTNFFIGMFAAVWAVNIIDAMILSWRRDQADFALDAASSHVDRIAVEWEQEKRLWRVQYQITW